MKKSSIQIDREIITKIPNTTEAVIEIIIEAKKYLVL